MKRNVRSFIIISAGLVVLGAGRPQRAEGQLLVVATAPFDRATAVNTAATLDIHFSAPLDTAAHFSKPEDFFIGFFMHPEAPVEAADSITVSYDLQSVRIHKLHLAPETRYVLTVFGARSVFGEMLQQPHTITFTTALWLPSGSCSGIIGIPGGDPSGTLVLLYGSPFSGKPEAFGVAPQGGEGAYEVNSIPPGVYWPMAIKDVNRNGSFDPEIDVDLLGAYDPDGDGYPDSLVVTAGSLLSSIDITLFPYKGITGSRRYREAQVLGRSWAADARLLKVAPSKPTAAGVCGMWIYLFHSSRRNEYFGVFASNSYLWTFSMDCDSEGCRPRRAAFVRSAESSL
jgi:hypothetical protein